MPSCPLSFAQGVPMPDLQQSIKNLNPNPTAIVYCEGNFGSLDGKTANGLVSRSEKYKILAVIDSDKAGQDSGQVLCGKSNGIPIFLNLNNAIEKLGSVPDYYIFGMAPATGLLSYTERNVILEAIHQKMNIVNGLHEFINDDEEFFSASVKMNVKMIDVRRPRAKKDLRLFSGRIMDVKCKRIAVFGTDCAVGKRTTANILNDALNSAGIRSVMIGTGQTGLIQGARYGVALDAVPSQFCAGELEATIIEAYEKELPEVIIIEGQGALSHPAYSTSSFILRGSCPHGVILQHPPGRKYRCDFNNMLMPQPKTEINLIQTFSDTKVIGLTINHENMTDAEVETAILKYKSELKIPVTDALTRPLNTLVQMVLSAFPDLAQKPSTQ